MSSEDKTYGKLYFDKAQEHYGHYRLVNTYIVLTLPFRLGMEMTLRWATAKDSIERDAIQEKIKNAMIPVIKTWYEQKKGKKVKEIVVHDCNIKGGNTEVSIFFSGE